MKAGPRKGSSARIPRVRPSIEARAAAWTATVRADAAPALEDAAPGPASSTARRLRRRCAIGDPSDDAGAADRQAGQGRVGGVGERPLAGGDRVSVRVVTRIAEEARHALLERVRQLVLQP